MIEILDRSRTEGLGQCDAAAEKSGSAPSTRLISIDALRGLCVAGMVLVNFPTDWVLRYHQLAHADWDGATATDMIFPLFLFLSGFSMVYSFASRSKRGASRGKLVRHVVARSSTLLCLGLFLNALPSFDLHTLHVFGVLQRIALCYLLGGLFVLGTGKYENRFELRVLPTVMLMLLVLVGVWAAVRFVQVPGYGAWRFDHDGNLGAVIDRALFGNRHLSDWGGPKRMWDADGLLSCISAVPNLLLGALAAKWVRSRRASRTAVLWMVLMAAALIGAAFALNSYLVINRKLWTDSFTVLSGGVSLGVFALTHLWLDQGSERGKQKRGKWLMPAMVYGSNAILGYVIYVLLLVLQGVFRLPGAHPPANWLPGRAYAALCRWINPYNTSLLYGLVAVAVVLGLLWIPYRRNIFLKL